MIRKLKIIFFMKFKRLLLEGSFHVAMEKKGNGVSGCLVWNVIAKWTRNMHMQWIEWTLLTKRLTELTWGIIGLTKKFTRLLGNTTYKEFKEVMKWNQNKDEKMEEIYLYTRIYRETAQCEYNGINREYNRRQFLWTEQDLSVFTLKISDCL